MNRILAVIDSISDQKSLVLAWFMIVLGPLAFAAPRWFERLGPPWAVDDQRFSWDYPTIQPFFECVRGRAAGQNADWDEIRRAARDDHSGGALSIYWQEPMFLSQLSEKSPTAASESGGATGFHRAVPNLEQLKLQGTQLSLEDWYEIRQLKQLWLLELIYTPPPTESPDDTAGLIAESLSDLPRLRQLSLVDSPWIQLGTMPALETLILDADHLPVMFRTESVAENFPQLRRLLIRLPAGYSLSERGIEALQRIDRLPQLGCVELWTGRSGQRRELLLQVDEFQQHLSRLRVTAAESGFDILESIIIFCVTVPLIGALLACAFWLRKMAVLSHNAVMPGFHDVHQRFFVGLCVLAVMAGLQSAWMLDVKWWFPVSIALLAVGLPGSLYRLLREDQENTLIPLVFLMFSLMTLGPNFLKSPVALGLSPLLNGGLFAASMITIATSWVSSHRLSAQIHECGETLYRRILQRGLGMKAESVARWPPAVSTDRMQWLLMGDWADRLRSATADQWLYRSAFFVVIVFWQTLRPSNPRVLGTSADFPKVMAAIYSGLWSSAAIALLHRNWCLHGKMLSSRFLMPTGRVQFWDAYRTAIFRDARATFSIVGLVWLGTHQFQNSWQDSWPLVCLRILLFIGSILLQVSMILLASVQGGSWRRSWHWQAASVLSGSFIALSFLRGHVSPSAGGLWRGLLMGHVLLAIAGVVLFWNLRRILQQQEVQH
jgi:hypothetical protein